MKNTTKKKKQRKDPYVYFDKSSIENRMRQDLLHFKGDDEELLKESRTLFKGPSLSLFHDMIKLSLDKIEEITKGKSYYDTIRNVEEEKQRQLWIYRTYLFYTFLWFVTYLFTHHLSKAL